jgi:hypothetical protein
MQQRRRFKHQESLEQRLEDEAMRLRAVARATQPSIERDRLLRQARHAETASHMSEWIRSPGLRPPPNL